MSKHLPHKAGTYGIISILIVLNLYQCYNSFQKNLRLKSLEERFSHAHSIASTEHERLGEYVSFQFEITPSVIEHVCLKTHLTLPDNTLCLFIPPFVCGTCLEQECSLLENDYPDIPVALLAPYGRDKNLGARYSSSNNITIIPYDPSSLDESSLRDFGYVICFVHESRAILSPFIPNVDFPHISEEYYSYIRSEYGL